MPKLRVQAFYQAEDDLQPFGGIQTIELTTAELARLQETHGEVTYLASRNAYYGLVDEEPGS